MPRMQFLKRILESAANLAGVPIVSLLAGGVLFLILERDAHRKMCRTECRDLGGVLFCSVGYWNREWFKKDPPPLLCRIAPAGVVLYHVAMILAPSGGTADARVRNCFLRGQGQFHRYSPWNVIPEVDQLKVGLSLLPLGPPEMDSAEARRMRSLVLPLYDEMDKDADFRELGSVMGMAYRDLGHMEFRTGHYLRAPAGNIQRPAASVLDLSARHGRQHQGVPLGAVEAVGQTKCAVIAPTFGFGNWDRPDGAELSSTSPAKPSRRSRWTRKRYF